MLLAGQASAVLMFFGFKGTCQMSLPSALFHAIKLAANAANLTAGGCVFDPSLAMT
jgi:hypothetical protein